MLRLLRSSRRWLASLLIAASPALGGSVLPLLHPCPVDAPWLMPGHAAGPETLAAAAPHTAHAMQSGGSHDDRPAADHPASEHDCNCVDCCTAPAVAAPPALAVLTVAVQPPVAPFWAVVAAGASAQHALDHLPESTAPPLG